MKKYKVEVDYRCTEVYFVEAKSKEDAREQMDSIDGLPADTCDVSWEVENVEEVTDEKGEMR
tara:strand:- start:1123 stop:1308 length:186 start_codon:yes stop_codon:yes gene_type:complete